MYAKEYISSEIKSILELMTDTYMLRAVNKPTRSHPLKEKVAPDVGAKMPLVDCPLQFNVIIGITMHRG